MIRIDQHQSSWLELQQQQQCSGSETVPCLQHSAPKKAKLLEARGVYLLHYKYPPSNFSYEMGRTWATVQIASQDFFVQTGGVVPPILYLESFCSWFLSNHAFSFCSCICWVSWSIQHKISLAFCHLTEYHLTNCTGSTLDPTKFNHWQLQNVLWIYVGRNFGWQRPNYKMSLGKIMLEIPTFSYFFDFRCIGFCSTGFELFSEPERVMFFIL